MAIKMSSVDKQLMYVLKLFRVIDGSVPFFGSVYSKETLLIMYPKCLRTFTVPLSSVASARKSLKEGMLGIEKMFISSFIINNITKNSQV